MFIVAKWRSGEGIGSSPIESTDIQTIGVTVTMIKVTKQCDGCGKRVKASDGEAIGVIDHRRSRWIEVVIHVTAEGCHDTEKMHFCSRKCLEAKVSKTLAVFHDRIKEFWAIVDEQHKQTAAMYGDAGIIAGYHPAMMPPKRPKAPPKPPKRPKRA